MTLPWDGQTLFTVAICTYNRAELLQICVDSVCKQDFPGAEFEVLVVDNASTDRTAEAVQELKQRYPSLRYVKEPQPGLSQARNKAWQEARGLYVAYIDDDARALVDWLAQARRVIDHHAPAAFGGPFLAYYRQPKPDWFKDDYASWSLMPQAGALPPDGHLCGSNLFVRREILATIGGFDPRLGMIGDKAAYGEETDFLLRLRRAQSQARLYYDPGVKVEHLAQPHKWQLSWQMRARFQAGRSGYLTFSDGHHRLSPRHVAGFMVLPLLILLEATAGMLFRNRQRYPAWQNYMYERVLSSVAVWGKLYERIRQVITQAGGRGD